MRTLGELEIGKISRELKDNEMKLIKGGYDNSTCETSDPLYCDGPCDIAWIDKAYNEVTGMYSDVAGHYVDGSCQRILGICHCYHM